MWWKPESLWWGYGMIVPYSVELLAITTPSLVLGLVSPYSAPLLSTQGLQTYTPFPHNILMYHNWTTFHTIFMSTWDPAGFQRVRYLKKRWTQSLILELLIGWISLKLFCHCFIILKLLLYLEISLLIDETFCVTTHSCAPTFELKMTKCNG